MGFRNVVFMCCLVTFNHISFAKERVRIAFFDESQANITYWDLLKENLDERVELVSENQKNLVDGKLSNSDILEAKRKFCSFIEETKDEQVVAVIAPRSLPVSSILESINYHLNIPYLITSWRPRREEIPANVFSLYPDADLFSRALASLIESLDWKGFAILYEDDDGLLRFQDVLKLQKYKKDSTKNEIIIEKLPASGNNRPVLKSLKQSQVNRIIIDCHVDKIMDLLRNAQEVNLLSDVSTSFFLTSLDAHMLNYSELNTHVNITLLRLFNPYEDRFLENANKYFPNISHTKITVENALMLDALMVVTDCINQLKAADINFGSREVHCGNYKQYIDDFGLISTMEKIELTDTLTGPISFQNGKRDQFVLEVIESRTPKNPIVIWRSENPDKVLLTRNATQREAEMMERIRKHNFIVTSRIGPPYLYKSKKPDAYKNSRYYGFSMDLIAEIAKIANITFEFMITEGNSYANLVNDLVERRADLGICDFTITPQRREVIDFSMPFMNLGIGILHKQNTQIEVDNMYAFMRPISWKVWFYMWTLSFASSLTMFIVARMAPGEWENPKPWDPESKELENIWTVKNFLWLSLGSITAQGCDILPKSVPTRIIAASWWFFSLIIMSSYTANLAAFLTMQKRDVTIDTVEELAAQSKVKYGLLEKGSTYTFFSTSNNSLYQKMWNTMKNEKPSVFVLDNPSGVERVLSTKNGLYAYFMESTGIEYELERKCDLRKIGGQLDSKSYGIGMPLNADYRHSINSAVLRLQESGKLMELKEKWWKNEREGEPCNRSTEEESVALALSNVGGIFIVLCVGISLAYVIAILEFLWHVRQVSVEEHLSYLETLKCEIKFALKIFEKKKRAKPLPSEPSLSTNHSGHKLDQISVGKTIFSKSVSLLHFTEPDNVMRHRQRRLSRISRAASSNPRAQ